MDSLRAVLTGSFVRDRARTLIPVWNPDGAPPGGLFRIGRRDLNSTLVPQTASAVGRECPGRREVSDVQGFHITAVGKTIL
jgi:hypothetical protein